LSRNKGKPYPDQDTFGTLFYSSSHGSYFFAGRSKPVPE